MCDGWVMNLAACAASGALYALITYLTGCSCIYSCFYRSKMRQQYMLPESPCADCLVHFCCEPCALCQEYRELKTRGFDMSLGNYLYIYISIPLLLILYIHTYSFNFFLLVHFKNFSLNFSCDYRVAWKYG